MALGQIFGKIYRFDDKVGHLATDDIKINAINLEDLEGCLIIFRAKGEEAMQKLSGIFTDEVIEDIGATVMVLNDELIAGIDVVDITEVEKMQLRKLDEKLAKRAERKESYDDRVNRILKETEKTEQE